MDTEAVAEIKIALALRGESRAAVARRAGLQVDRVQRILRGDYPPRPEEIAALSRALGLEPREAARA